MKKYIREMMEDLKHSKVKVKSKTLTPPAEAALPGDLSNQVLSKNAAEKVKQLDYQAQQSERLQTNS